MAAGPSDISMEDLVSHLGFLENHGGGGALPESQILFERGLTYQLLADAAVAGSDGTPLLGRDELLRRAEESYRGCLLADARNADALSNLARLLSSETDAGCCGYGTASAGTVVELYERALSSDPLHFQSYVNYGTFLRRQLGRHAEAAAVLERGLRHLPNLETLRYERGPRS